MLFLSRNLFKMYALFKQIIVELKHQTSKAWTMFFAYNYRTRLLKRLFPRKTVAIVTRCQFFFYYVLDIT